MVMLPNRDIGDGPSNAVFDAIRNQEKEQPRRPYRLSDENSRRQDPEVQYFLHS